MFGHGLVNILVNIFLRNAPFFLSKISLSTVGPVFGLFKPADVQLGKMRVA
jgi:hypothetical protein